MKHRPRLLVVDDDPSERELVEATAAGAGADIIWCGSGEEGLARASSEPFDAILIDILMPDRIGYEICRRLKSNPETADVPLLFVTARNREADVLAGFEALAFDFVLKPYQSRELKARIQNALRQKSLLVELYSLASFYESCLSLWRAFDDAESPESARRNVTRELENIAAAFEAEGASFSLDQELDLLSCGNTGNVPAAEIPIVQGDAWGIFRLYRATPCNAEEKLRLADLASTLSRGIRRFFPPPPLETPLTLE